jgi:DNA-binding GntR family transcriptional regulator
VRILSVEDAIDIYLAREAIEVCAVQQSLELNAPTDLSRLRQAVERMRKSVVKDGRPSAKTIDADLDFHRELVRLARSDRLNRAFETLAAENRMVLRHHPRYPSRTYVSDHEQLLAAISAMHSQTPELVRQHLRSSARLIADEMAQGSLGPQLAGHVSSSPLGESTDEARAPRPHIRKSKEAERDGEHG